VKKAQGTEAIPSLALLRAVFASLVASVGYQNQHPLTQLQVLLGRPV
jgi:hypothetical protein